MSLCPGVTDSAKTLNEPWDDIHTLLGDWCPEKQETLSLQNSHCLSCDFSSVSLSRDYYFWWRLMCMACIRPPVQTKVVGIIHISFFPKEGNLKHSQTKAVVWMMRLPLAPVRPMTEQPQSNNCFFFLKRWYFGILKTELLLSLLYDVWSWPRWLYLSEIGVKLLLTHLGRPCRKGAE